MDLYNEIDKQKIHKHELLRELEDNCSKKVELYFGIKNRARTLALEDHYCTYARRKIEFNVLHATLTDLEVVKKEETSLTIKLNNFNSIIKSKQELYKYAMEPYKSAINTSKEKFYEELDVIFNAKCLICYEIGIPVKLNIPCCLPNNNGTIHCAGSFCLACCKKFFSIIEPEIKCPVCRTIYTRHLLNMNLYLVDQDKIRLIDKYICNFWKNHTANIENVSEIPKSELKILNCDRCDKSYNSLFDIFRHQTGKTIDICDHAFVPCKICKLVFYRKDITNNYCNSCLYI